MHRSQDGQKEQISFPLQFLVHILGGDDLTAVNSDLFIVHGSNQVPSVLKLFDFIRVMNSQYSTFSAYHEANLETLYASRGTI